MALQKFDFSMIVMHYNHRLIEQKGSIAHKIIQELSDRKHIARQLCTLYVEGMYNDHVTLKSSVRVLQVIGNDTIG